MNDEQTSIRIRAWLTSIAQGNSGMDIPEEAKIALHEFDRLEKENAQMKADLIETEDAVFGCAVELTQYAGYYLRGELKADNAKTRAEELKAKSQKLHACHKKLIETYL